MFGGALFHHTSMGATGAQAHEPEFARLKPSRYGLREGRKLMTKPIPDGWHSVTPRLVVPDAATLVEFLKRAFGATGEFRADSPSQIRIGDSLVMVTSAGPRDAMPSFLYLYVDDIDGTFARALQAGAVPLEMPQDMPYGDRRGMVKDPGGNIWQIATHQHDVPMES